MLLKITLISSVVCLLIGSMSVYIFTHPGFRFLLAFFNVIKPHTQVVTETISHSGIDFEIDIYNFIPGPISEIVIFLHGYVRSGKRHPAAVNISKSIAWSKNMTVVVPDIKSFMDYDIRSSLGIMYMYRGILERFKPAKVSVWSACVGASIFLRAVEKEKMQPDTMLMIGPFFSGVTLMKNILKDKKADPRGILVLALNSPSFSKREKIEIRETLLKLKDSDSTPDQLDLQASLKKKVYSQKPDIPGLKEWSWQKNFCPDKKTRFFIIHLKDDHIVPYTESELLTTAIMNSKCFVRLYIPGLGGHTHVSGNLREMLKMIREAPDFFKAAIK